MKQRKRILRICSLLLAGFLLFCTELTGCGDRSAGFLEEELQGTEDAEASETPGISGGAGAQDQRTGNPEVSGAQNPEAGSSETTGAPDAETGNPEATGAQNPEAGNSGASGVPGAQAEAAGPDGQESGGQAGEDTAAEIYVDVCGAVVSPGVYKLEGGSRVFQAVEAAGGYLPEAAEGYVNLARGLSDGQQIYIPTEKELEERGIQPGGEAMSGNLEAQTGTEAPGDTAAGTAADAAGAGTSGAGTAEASGGGSQAGDSRVNINTADEAALTTLTGIGATRAQAIIAYREANGPFGAIEDIMNVQGIKEGTFAKIKDEIVVG